MLDSGIKPCKQQAKQKSCRTVSVKEFWLLALSNMPDKVGKALVSTWLNASVMQNWAVKGGNIEDDSVASSKGSLLIR